MEYGIFVMQIVNASPFNFDKLIDIMKIARTNSMETPTRKGFIQFDHITLIKNHVNV